MNGDLVVHKLSLFGAAVLTVLGLGAGLAVGLVVGSSPKIHTTYTSTTQVKKVVSTHIRTITVGGPACGNGAIRTTYNTSDSDNNFVAVVCADGNTYFHKVQ